jgi:pimeloyl-ACP methyl ester carboxylesterase
MPGVFIPGWGASAALYRGLVPGDWDVLEPPSFRASKGALGAYRAWLRDELARRPGPITLGGHSFGAALAVLAANDGHANIDRLVLVGPAGLPLSKPLGRSMRDFGAQVVTGLYPLVEAVRLTRAALAAPNSALRLAQAVRRLDLRSELRSLRGKGVPCTVVAADTDTLTTPAHCRAIAELAGGDYRELSVGGGHMWFLATLPR